GTAGSPAHTAVAIVHTAKRAIDLVPDSTAGTPTRQHARLLESGKKLVPSGQRLRPHQMHEVPAVERLQLLLTPPLQRRLEPLQRIPPALDVRIVRREHEQLGPAALDAWAAV